MTVYLCQVPDNRLQKFAVNSAVISNYQGISKLWRKREGAGRRALGCLDAVVHPINNQPVDPDG
jgi:hypothetical protein